jgi:hypothetical protein
MKVSGIINFILMAVSAFAVAMLCSCSAARADWEPIGDMDGVRVYSKEEPGFSSGRYKGEVIVDARPEVVGEVIRDFSSGREWITDCIESRILRKNSEDDMILYHVIRAPWPISYRDSVSRASVIYDGKSSRIVIIIKDHADPTAQGKNGYIRVKSLDAKWVLEGSEQGKTMVSYIISAEPGGNVPDFLTEHALNKNPYLTLINLKKMVKRQKYHERAGKRYKFRDH